MPTFELQDPSGRRFEVDAPDQTSAISAFQKFQAGEENGAGGAIPPPPPGFVLDHQANGAIPPPPPGFVIDGQQRAPGHDDGGLETGRAAILGATDGATFGFGDEIAAGLGYLLDKLPGERGRSYDELLSTARGAQKQAEEEHPYVYTAGQIGGGLAAAAPIAGAGIVGGAARSLPARLAISSGTGAAAGAVQGFGSGEGGLENRSWEALKGAGWGLGMGAAAIPAGAAIGKGLNAAADLIASRGSTLGRSSQDLLRRTLADEGLTLEEAGRRASVMGPDAMLADTTDGLRYRAEQIAQSDNPGRSSVIGALRDRSATAGDRINSAYDDVLGQRPNVKAELDRMSSEQKTRADALYGQARAENAPVDVSPVLKAIDDQLLTPAERIAGAPDLPDDAVDASLRWVRSHLSNGDVQRTGIDKLDKLERRVRAKASAEFKTGHSDTGSALANVGRILRDQMKASSPVYKQARETFADDAAVQDAFEKGQSIFARKTHPDFLAAEVADMSEAERNALRLGTRAAVDQAMGSVRNGSLKGRQLLDADWNERKILAVLGEDDGRRLINALQGEQAMAETVGQALGNSATSRRMDNPFRVQQRTEQDKAVPGIVRSLANLKFGDAVFRGVEYGKDALERRSADAMARELGPFLTATGQTREQRIMEALGVGANRDAVAREAQKRKAIAEALLRGGALAVAPQLHQ
ncbi:hypothetical protein GCM10011390_10260 [Aureimonas endophytica]|uniref:Uncharacterized protein n=1 Tax=Aureimonas endophytica TaxID=2027858 RepID=A0A917E299_9HYPH|nr:hypothetical protein [Aureimonas endophytica]GGD93434.1 hypothetical protein GCM10011390_10260 [Aureimonas endophytica]